MENASKALIIAGAILISILLITLGIIVYNGSKSTIDTSMDSLDSTTSAMDNSRISQYAGSGKTYTMASALIDQLATYKTPMTVTIKSKENVNIGSRNINCWNYTSIIRKHKKRNDI